MMRARNRAAVEDDGAGGTRGGGVFDADEAPVLLPLRAVATREKRRRQRAGRLGSPLGVLAYGYTIQFCF